MRATDRSPSVPLMSQGTFPDAGPGDSAAASDALSRTLSRRSGAGDKAEADQLRARTADRGGAQRPPTKRSTRSGVHPPSRPLDHPSALRRHSRTLAQPRPTVVGQSKSRILPADAERSDAPGFQATDTVVGPVGRCTDPPGRSDLRSRSLAQDARSSRKRSAVGVESVVLGSGSDWTREPDTG